MLTSQIQQTLPFILFLKPVDGNFFSEIWKFIKLTALRYSFILSASSQSMAVRDKISYVQTNKTMVFACAEPVIPLF